VETAAITASHHRSQLVIIGDSRVGIPSLSWQRFTNLFGGPINSTSPLEPEVAQQLVELGYNRLPTGLAGGPDELFELHVQAALEFILAGRVIRYGQDRRFEVRPDGIALPHERFRALYDAKAYANGYPVTAESLRQFKTYVDDFVSRYEAYLLRLNSFIVISSTFAQGDAALTQRHQEFIASAGIPLSFMRAETLAGIVRLMSANPAYRRSIDWARIFASPVVELNGVEEALHAAQADRIVTRGS